MREGEKVADVFSRHMGASVGQHTVAMALKMFAKQAIGVPPDQVQIGDAMKLLDAMRPMLNTLLGSQKSEQVVQLIRRDLGI